MTLCSISLSRAVEAITDTGEPSVSDDHLLPVQEHVPRVQPLVEDAPGMQVPHPRGDLPGDIDTLLQGEYLRPDVEVLVEGVASAETVRGEGQWVWFVGV